MGVSLLFLAFRLYVRLRVFRRVFDDDILVILAWLVLLATVIIWPVRNTLELIYVSYRVAFGGLPPPAYYLENFTSWLHFLFAETFLNICGLWLVKLSFFRLLPKARLSCKWPEDLVVGGIDSYGCWVGHLHWRDLLSMRACHPRVRSR